jgi:GWxTD domain-containing protein
MRNRLLIVFMVLSGVSTQAQILRTINFNYIYWPKADFTFQWKVLNRNNQIEVTYSLERNSESISLSEYDILWELRKDISEKEGTPITKVSPISTTAQLKSGSVTLEASAAGQVIVAKVANAAKKQVWLYFTKIPATAQPFTTSNGNPLTKNYTSLEEPLALKGFGQNTPVIISYYNDNFPSAAPPFSTAQARVAPVLKVDSVFSAEPGQPLAFTKTGLYLAQQDTASMVGVAFRVEDDYPKLGKIASLTGPLIYICTKQEYEKVKAAGEDKTLFDKAILSITGNTDRARTFMRSYFRNVELANRYFTSYKEGWKTDRGMIFIIYGAPDAVYLLGDREVWEYKNTMFNGQFTFVKSSSLFDPENYVLIRDKAYEDTWYLMIDLWRKARF